MQTYLIDFYLYCKWDNVAPTYRLYCDGNLMTERTYIWHNDEHVLEERVPLLTKSDKAVIRIEQVGQHSGIFSVKHVRPYPDLDVTIEIV